VLGIAIERVRARRGQQPTAPVQVPQPPVQLPPIGNGIVNFFMAAFAGSQPVANGDPICGLALTMGSTVEPERCHRWRLGRFHLHSYQPWYGRSRRCAGRVGPAGRAQLRKCQQRRRDRAADWIRRLGVAGGSGGWCIDYCIHHLGSVADAGQWENHACSAGLDAEGNDVGDCTTATLMAGHSRPRPRRPAPSRRRLRQLRQPPLRCNRRHCR
jgi:hypothetical protein